MATDSPSETARAVLDLALARPPTLGSGRLICVDGPAGSGKTTLAAAIAALTSARVLHMDDLYDGWDGLPHVTDQLDRILQPLTAGTPGSYRRYDWDREEYAETVAVDPTALLVLEGVGSGSRPVSSVSTVLVWVVAPADLRLDRGLVRDGAHLESRWRQWMLDEAAHFERDQTAARADLVARTGP